MTTENKIMIMGKDGVSTVLKSDAADKTSFLNEVICLSGKYSDHVICAELYFENYTAAFLKEPGTVQCREFTYYNDFDDYEDDIMIGSDRWLAMFRQ